MPITSSTLMGLSQQQATYTHPTYLTLKPVWEKLRDVRDGAGGFLDGRYLVAHPREWKDHEATNPRKPTKKFQARRDLACYENFAGTMVSSMQSALFREQAVRRVGDESDGETDVERWWQDVDGTGLHIDEFMKASWDLAATFGHMVLYMDRAKPAVTPAKGETYTAADEAMPFLRGYTPLDVMDWTFNDLGLLTGIKFAEAAPRKDLMEPVTSQTRIRVIDDTTWKLYDIKGNLEEQGAHNFGVVPVVFLFTIRRPLDQALGTSVLGDPKLYIDLYNLTSEIRELLRNQTFGILNIPLGTGPDAMDVEKAMQLAAGTKGTDNVLFSGTAANYIQPDVGNIEAYHAEASRRLRSIYRQASLAWESDSKDAEAEGSLKLKREDMNQRLSSYADELERTEYALCELFYRATYGSEGWESRWDAAEPQIKYPDTFDLTPFEELEAQATAAAGLGMPSRFLKEQRKMLVGKFTGMADLPQSILDEIETAIEAAPDDLTPAEKEQQRGEQMAQAIKGMGGPQVTVPKLKVGAKPEAA